MTTLLSRIKGSVIPQHSYPAYAAQQQCLSDIQMWVNQPGDSADARLYLRLAGLAHSRRWNPANDIDWTPVNTQEYFPCVKEADPFCGFDAYDSLPQAQRIHISWQRHAVEISEILHGEQLALMCAAQLVSLMPCLDSRLFAGTQAADEARHVDFFRRYLQSAGLQIYPPSSCLQQLTTQALRTERWEIKLLICQLLIESLALAQFSYLAATQTAVSLTSGLRRILDDEARHVKFGSNCLQSLLRDRPEAERQDYAHFVIDSAFELAASDNQILDTGRSRCWNVAELRRHLRLRRLQKPQLLHRRFRQLCLNLEATGLMNDSVKQRIKRFTGTV